MRRLPWLAPLLLLACSARAPGEQLVSDASTGEVGALLPQPRPIGSRTIRDAATASVDLSVEPTVDLGVDLGADLETVTLSVPPETDGAPQPDLIPHTSSGPWPTGDLTVYGALAGLAGNLVDASPDDAQNIWAASSDGLYLLRPGMNRFVRYGAADGLHIEPFIDPNGQAAVTNITAVAGGRGGEVFVGYYGFESDDRFADTFAQRQLGQADRVTVGDAGQLTVRKYLFRCDYENSTCWEDRSVRRMVFAHSGSAAGHLFIGFDHGVAHVFDDQLGDHIHVETWYHYPDGQVVEKVGEQYGLFVMPSGELWTAGAYGAGLQAWNPVPHFAWVAGRFREAFTVFSDDHGLDVPAGYREDHRGVAVTSDGTVWFASRTRGLASWNMSRPTSYAATRTWPAAPTQLIDLAADPDGTVWLVTLDGDLVRFDPKANGWQLWLGVSGVRRIVMDTTVTPRALYVSMGHGLAVIRAK